MRAILTAYYILDTKTYFATVILSWWRPEQAGYTTLLDEAGRYDEATARQIERTRKDAVPIPCDVAERLARRIVLSDPAVTAYIEAATRRKTARTRLVPVPKEE